MGNFRNGPRTHAADKSVAMGYIARELMNETNGFEIEILGQIYKAVPQAEALFDADAKQMRA